MLMTCREKTFYLILNDCGAKIKITKTSQVFHITEQILKCFSRLDFKSAKMAGNWWLKMATMPRIASMTSLWRTLQQGENFNKSVTFLLFFYIPKLYLNWLVYKVLPLISKIDLFSIEKLINKIITYIIWDFTRYFVFRSLEVIGESCSECCISGSIRILSGRLKEDWLIIKYY